MDTDKLQSAMDQVDREMASTTAQAQNKNWSQPRPTLPVSVMQLLRQIDQRLQRLERQVGGTD